MSMEHVPTHLQPCISVIDAQLASLKMQFRQLKRARKLLCGDAADVTVRGSLGPLPVDVTEWLRTNPGWHTAPEIAKALGTTGHVIGAWARTKLPGHLVDSRQRTNNLAEYSYRLQIATGTGT